jgi:hypothetical protein
MKLASFYRRADVLFEGVLTGSRDIHLSLNPEGLIKTVGKDILHIHGTAAGHSVSEDLTSRLSLYRFSYIDTISPKNSSFTGKVNIVDSSGAIIPVNSLLFVRPIEIMRNYLQSAVTIRSQEDVGLSVVDRTVTITVRYKCAEDLVINDRVTVDNQTFLIRDIFCKNPAHWILQAIIKDP